ncbi:MAG: LysM peptidoglycan-binding domain-containing protein [Elusimicrobia bacterium]|nr:LysM peptidoglycan-binding domain-containing protein [Elusimicrobiota bacterium]
MTQKLHGAESYQIAVSLLTEGQAILAELKAGSSSSGHGPADALVYLLQAEALLQNSVKALEPEKAARHETGAVQSALAAVSRTYKVSRGDTLWGISKKLYKTPWRWNDIWKLNSAKIPVYKRMSSGTVLKLPG